MARFIFSAFADESGGVLSEQIAHCKENGITHIEIRGLGDGRNISKISVDEAKEVKKLLDETGMKISSIGSSYGKIEITDDFEPHFEAFKNTIEVAKILEAKYIRIFSFYFKNGESYDEYKEEVFRRVKIMAEYAHENGIFACHENEVGIYGDIPERVLELHKAVGDKLGGIFDPANYIHCHVDIPSAYDMLEDYIEYFHIKDARHSDGVVTPAGYGDAGFENLIRRFAQKDGARVLSVEPHLQVFEGLNELEAGAETLERLKATEFKYANRQESFGAAVSAIREIVEKVQPIRLGIIGVGNMGTSHVKFFVEGKIKEMRLVAIADLRQERLDFNKDRVYGVTCFKMGEELIDSGLCDAVIVAVPHYDHPKYVKYAIEKGLHVVSEKPAGVYTKQVREMNEFAAKHDKVFAMMFNQRTNHVYRKMKEIVSSGRYGEVKRSNWVITDWYRCQSYYNSGGWRATWEGEGGGVLLNQCPHNLDLWQWICGMPTKIRAFCHEGKWHNIEVEDDVTIYAEYENGATGVFVTTTGDAPGTNRFEVTLDGAKLICEDGELKVYELEMSTKEHCATCENGFHKPDGKWIEVETDGKNDQHVGVLNAFAAKILRNEPLVAEGYEGINGLTISNAAHLSSWLDKTIELPVDEDLFYSELQKKIASSTGKAEPVVETVQTDLSGTYGTK